MRHPVSFARSGLVSLGTPLLLAAVVTCALAQTDMSSFYADPAKYTLYGCKQLAQARPLLLYRIQKLEALMAKANAGSGGQAASALAYNNDYLTLRGDLRNLDTRAVDRNCPPMPQHAQAPPEEVPPITAPEERAPGR
jgi:hypothetical protein